MSDIVRAWERIEAQFAAVGCSDQLCDGATPEALSQLESDLGLPLPDELKESLSRHDGSEDGGWPTGTLLSCELILSEANVWRELLAGGDFDDAADHDPSDGAEKVKRGWWQQGWIPLDADGGGNGAVIDTDPGPAGALGQILDMDHEVGPSGPTHPSLAGYLNDIASMIDEEEYVWEDGGWEMA